jgi:hypothetical protein
VYGRKRWYLAPPLRSVYSTAHPLVWSQNNVSGMGDDVVQCIQEEGEALLFVIPLLISEGDVIFVPESWGHAVLNLDESVGFASEFVYGQAEFTV